MDTKEKVTKIILEHLGLEAEKVQESSRFKEDLGADSLDIVELVMAFEEEFEIEIADEVTDKMNTVGDVINYISESKKIIFMLELNYSNININLNCCIFPKTIVFCGSNNKYSFLFEAINTIKTNKNYFCYLPKVEVFHPKLTLQQNLYQIASIFQSTSLVPAAIKYFNINENLLNIKFSLLQKRYQVLTPFCMLFLKQSFIWCLNVDDIILEKDDLSFIQNLILAKIYNENAYIFYTTKSGDNLKLDNQIIL